MTAKKKTPGKRGRKAAPPGAKLSQLTIRIPPSQHVALAMLARDRGLSISQAVEFSLAQVLKDYAFEGVTLNDFLRGRGYAMSFSFGAEDMDRHEAAVEMMAEEALHSDPFFIMLMPERLRTPEERFFFEVFAELAVDHAGKLQVNSELAEQLLLACKSAFRRGEAAEDVVAEWKGALG